MHPLGTFSQRVTSLCRGSTFLKSMWPAKGVLGCPFRKGRKKTAGRPALTASVPPPPSRCLCSSWECHCKATPRSRPLTTTAGTRLWILRANDEIRGSEQSVQDNPDASTPGRCQWARFQRLWDRPGSAHRLRLKGRWGGPGTLSAEPGAPCTPSSSCQRCPASLGAWRWHSRHKGQMGLLGGNKNTKAIVEALGLETR